jgi:hypothetical protein
MIKAHLCSLLRGNIMNKHFKLILSLALMLGCVPPPAFADQPGKHPFYLHALADLRSARHNIVRAKGDAEVRWDESRAIFDIDAAIRKIKEAAIDDGKNLDDRQPVDAREPYSGRLHRALAALKSAHDDVDREENNEFAHGLKRRALQDIDNAMVRTREGLCNAGNKEFCSR